MVAAGIAKKKYKSGPSGKNLIKECEYCQRTMRSDNLTKHIGTVHRDIATEV